MDASNSFDDLMGQLHDGQADAARQVFDRFRERLLGLARGKIRDPRIRAKFDPEDVVQSAFITFWRRCRDGEYELDGWESLWKLLATITDRRCARYHKHYGTRKRSVRREQSPPEPHEVDRMEPPSSESSPAEMAILSDLLDGLLHQLDDSSQLTLILKLQGCTESEICQELKCSTRSVRRRVAHIRSLLEEDHG